MHCLFFMNSIIRIAFEEIKTITLKKSQRHELVFVIEQLFIFTANIVKYAYILSEEIKNNIILLNKMI